LFVICSIVVADAGIGALNIHGVMTKHLISEKEDALKVHLDHVAEKFPGYTPIFTKPMVMEIEI